MYTDADLVKDIVTRHWVTSVVHEYNSAAFAWKIQKQGGVTHHTNGLEIRACFTGIKRTKIFRRFLESMGRPIKGPTPAYEDNNADTQQIHADKLTSSVKHTNIMMSWLHEQHVIGTYVAIYCNT